MNSIHSFRKLLRENAKKIEKKSAKSETEEIIKTPNETPKMVKTVIQVIWPWRGRVVVVVVVEGSMCTVTMVIQVIWWWR